MKRSDDVMRWEEQKRNSELQWQASENEEIHRKEQNRIV